MHYIIDGYNLLKSDPETAMYLKLGLEYARESLLARLESASGLKTAQSVTVVFDGHREGQPTESRVSRGKLLVIYSSLGVSADDVIKRLVSTHTGEVKVISRDLELKDAAAQAGQSSGNIKRRAFQSLTSSRAQGNKDDASTKVWDNTTRKKGNSRKSPKKRRQENPDVYW